MHEKTKGQPFGIENATEVLGNDFFLKLKEIECSVMLHHAIFGYFERCRLMNEVLSEENYFLRFYKRRNMFPYQLRQKLKSQNEMKRELSACTIQKFNGYELLRNHLQYHESKDFIPTDIVYEPTLDPSKSIKCYYAPYIYLRFYASVEKNQKGYRMLNQTKVRQCQYCQNYFVKSEEKMKKHLACCAGKDGFTFSFDNGKIIDYQDHYKSLGEVPFSAYYDFETTTGSVVFFDAKMYVVSYCMIFAFHPDINILRICIDRSYDQSPDRLTSLSHFEAVKYSFFSDKELYNKVILKQLEDAAFSVQNREKNTALPEIFSVEWKFTIDCLKNWFDKEHKSNNLELKVEDKNEFIEKNQKNPASLCCFDFSLDARQSNGWSDHVFKAEHRFCQTFILKKK